jgi:hypothetical protein
MIPKFNTTNIDYSLEYFGVTADEIAAQEENIIEDDVLTPAMKRRQEAHREWLRGQTDKTAQSRNYWKRKNK